MNDLRKLAMGLCMLAALPALPAAAQLKVAFPSIGGPEIDGYVYRPEGAGPFPAVVGMHGCSGMWNREGRVSALLRLWVRVLTAEGYVVLLVDGFTPRGVVSDCNVGSAKVTPALVRPRDAHGGLRWLQEQPYVRGDRVAIMGWSHGGGTVLYAAGPGNPVAVSDLPKGGFRAAVSLYPGSCYIRRHGNWYLPTMPLLTLLGAADNWTPLGPCVELMERIKSRGGRLDYVVYPDAHHGFDGPSNEVVPLIGLVGADRINPPLVGGNPVARADTQLRVKAFLAENLRGD